MNDAFLLFPVVKVLLKMMKGNLKSLFVFFFPTLSGEKLGVMAVVEECIWIKW
jgi:hypothetical protein